MLYPPQDLNFSLNCPNDSANNWLIVSSEDNGAKVRCQSCGKEYDLTFKQMPEDMKTMLSKIQFLHSGSAPCWQCGSFNNYSTTSHQKEVHLHCSKCGLDYIFKPFIKLKRDISTISESIEKKEESKDKIEQKVSPALELIMAELNSRVNE
jgi:DNA-directed RNA polymerase subunit M/transcription elongation factor TFIIS